MNEDHIPLAAICGAEPPADQNLDGIQLANATDRYKAPADVTWTPARGVLQEGGVIRWDDRLFRVTNISPELVVSLEEIGNKADGMAD